MKWKCILARLLLAVLCAGQLYAQGAEREQCIYDCRIRFGGPGFGTATNPGLLRECFLECETVYRKGYDECMKDVEEKGNRSFQ
jgi:hypothetical protein